jgi:hypothetical protein
MGDYLNIANSSVFFVCGGVIILFIIIQASIFIGLAYREGKKIGLSSEKMLRAIRTGAVSSIVPTLAIIAALITMIPVLGIPVPWIRLSVIGSAPYELMAAGIGAKAMGLSGLGGAGYTREVFATSVWIMCIGSVWAVSIVIFFLKKIKTKYNQVLNKDHNWSNILTNAAFLGVFCIFIADPLTKGGIALTTLLSGAAFMTVFAIMIVKLEVNWLKEFALTFSMFGAMLCAILFSGKLF